MDDFEKQAEAAYEWILSSWASGKYAEKTIENEKLIKDAFQKIFAEIRNRSIMLRFIPLPIGIKEFLPIEREIMKQIKACDSLIAWSLEKGGEDFGVLTWFISEAEGYGVTSCAEEIRYVQSLREKLNNELTVYRSIKKKAGAKTNVVKRTLVVELAKIFENVTGKKPSVSVKENLYDTENEHYTKHIFYGDFLDLIYGVAVKFDIEMKGNVKRKDSVLSAQELDKNALGQFAKDYI